MPTTPKVERRLPNALGLLALMGQARLPRYGGSESTQGRAALGPTQHRPPRIAQTLTLNGLDIQTIQGYDALIDSLRAGNIDMILNNKMEHISASTSLNAGATP